MRDVRIDSIGELRCWKCGSATFQEKRTLRSKALVGVGALLTKKKLKCRACGEYNDAGNAKPYTGPASTRLGKKYGTLTNIVGENGPQPVPGDMAAELAKLAELHHQGVLSDQEFEAAKARLLA